MTATRRRDPAAKPDATIASLTLAELPTETLAADRRYIAHRAHGEADERLLLAVLGLDQPPG
ncbi:hypothetical protein ACIQC7_27720 [Kitasatospora sp. NPDC088556]|uniref:hypothetical protein n=1 Tax=Kitasatospora sp. NPDC088556 TaxID=3364076 RepID=UPI0037FF6F84